MRDRLIVLKFGGSVLVDEASFERCAREVGRWHEEGWSVIAVVSALSGRTDGLLAWGAGVHEGASARARAGLLGLGEMESAALMGLHLEREGIACRVATAAAIRARGHATDAAPVGFEEDLFVRALEGGEAVVCPGFVGIDEEGRLATFGRGGSDLTALYLTRALGAARCRLVKDVDGLYEFDPARATGRAARARRFERVAHEDALALAGAILQRKAARFARAHGVVFEVGCLGAACATIVGAEASVFDEAALGARQEAPA